MVWEVVSFSIFSNSFAPSVLLSFTCLMGFINGGIWGDKSKCTLYSKDSWKVQRRHWFKETGIGTDSTFCGGALCRGLKHRWFLHILSYDICYNRFKFGNTWKTLSLESIKKKMSRRRYWVGSFLTRQCLRKLSVSIAPVGVEAWTRNKKQRILGQSYRDWDPWAVHPLHRSLKVVQQKSWG